jgi:hypothetical protein
MNIRIHKYLLKPHKSIDPGEYGLKFRKYDLKFPVVIFLFCLLNSCIVQFIPSVSEDKELLVVQGVITDQPEQDTIKLSKSQPLGLVSDAIPITGCNVTLSDNQGMNISLNEMKPGSYVAPQDFHGEIGRLYTLHIKYKGLDYESTPMEMMPVPSIDSLFWKKITLEPSVGFFKGVDACQIYLNSYDPQNLCKYYRWDFMETWILRLLFPVVNQTCWISERSHDVNIKNTSTLTESRIDHYPIKYITNVTDRLKTEYSILVNQYSMSEEEYVYWEKIQNVNVNVGGLYDIIPASIPSNMKCIEDPSEQVLGYFSVSAKSSKRIFIKDNFAGIINHYADCVLDTTAYVDPPGLGVFVWILEDEPHFIPPFKVLTDKKGCADCTVRGSNIKPDFWDDK